MNPLQLFLKSRKEALDAHELQWIREHQAKYPYFSLLHFISAKNASQRRENNLDSLRNLASLYANDRKKFAGYIEDKFYLSVSDVASLFAQKPEAKPTPKAEAKPAAVVAKTEAKPEKKEEAQSVKKVETTAQTEQTKSDKQTTAQTVVKIEPIKPEAKPVIEQAEKKQPTLDTSKLTEVQIGGSSEQSQAKPERKVTVIRPEANATQSSVQAAQPETQAATASNTSASSTVQLDSSLQLRIQLRLGMVAQLVQDLNKELAKDRARAQQQPQAKTPEAATEAQPLTLQPVAETQPAATQQESAKEKEIVTKAEAREREPVVVAPVAEKTIEVKPIEVKPIEVKPVEVKPASSEETAALKITKLPQSEGVSAPDNSFDSLRRSLLELIQAQIGDDSKSLEKLQPKEDPAILLAREQKMAEASKAKAALKEEMVRSQQQETSLEELNKEALDQLKSRLVGMQTADVVAEAEKPVAASDATSQLQQVQPTAKIDDRKAQVVDPVSEKGKEKSTIPGRIRSDSMTRFVEPEFTARADHKQDPKALSQAEPATDKLREIVQAEAQPVAKAELVQQPQAEQAIVAEKEIPTVEAKPLVVAEEAKSVVEAKAVVVVSEADSTKAEVQTGKQKEVVAAQKTEERPKRDKGETLKGDSSLRRFVQPEFAMEKGGIRLSDELRPDPALRAEVKAQEQKTEDKGSKLQVDESHTTDSFKRFVRPTFDTQAEQQTAQAVETQPSAQTEVQPKAEVQPKEAQDSGLTTESFKRFVQPQFGETIIEDVQPKLRLEREKKPQAEAKQTEQSTTTESNTSESFKRFVQPSFGMSVEQEFKPSLTDKDDAELKRKMLEAAERDRKEQEARAKMAEENKPTTIGGMPYDDSYRTDSFRRFVQPSFGGNDSVQLETQPKAEQNEQQTEAQPSTQTQTTETVGSSIVVKHGDHDIEIVLKPDQQRYFKAGSQKQSQTEQTDKQLEAKPEATQQAAQEKPLAMAENTQALLAEFFPKLEKSEKKGGKDPWRVLEDALSFLNESLTTDLGHTAEREHSESEATQESQPQLVLDTLPLKQLAAQFVSEVQTFDLPVNTSEQLSTTQDFEQRIDAFRENLNRIRTRNSPYSGEINLRNIQQKFLDSIIQQMSGGSQAKAREQSSTQQTQEESSEQTDVHRGGNIEAAVDRYKQLEPVIANNMATLRENPNQLLGGEGNLPVLEQAELSDEMLTETLAQLHISQGNTDKAIAIYSRLQLKMPDKSAYFARLIETLKQA